MSESFGNLVNNFGPLTPEQEDVLRRQGVQSGMGPLELLSLTGLGAGIGVGMAGIGGALSLGQGLATRGDRLPALLEYLKGIGVVGGAGAGAGFGFDTLNATSRQRETHRDAEGQPGGFYGQRR